MRFTDYIETSFSNLWKMKLRTFLTTFGVVIGIGALVSMFAFGKGMQNNVTSTFNELGLFNYISVFPRSAERNQNNSDHYDPDDQGYIPPAKDINQPVRILDEDFVKELSAIEGVEAAFPEIRFPAMVRFNDKENFEMIQALPAQISKTGFIKLREGSFFDSDEENSVLISDSMLRNMGIKDAKSVIGKKLEISTLAFELSIESLPNILSFLQGKGLPFSSKNYQFTISGVMELTGMSGPIAMRTNILIPAGISEKMKKIQITSISDIFQSIGQPQGYSMVGIKLKDPKYIDSVKKWVEDSGFNTFALIDQLEEIKRMFIFMDLFFFAIAMIAITVASLGIVNTLVMSILERYREIGIMKAVGASNGDIKKIFLFEAGLIGFLGGVFGLALGWIVSTIINLIANQILSGQGVPHMSYFSFPLWLCLGSITFSILISLLAGIYPTIRASKVDPVVALRHD
ncbi:MAG: ABC transporter permease [Sedimentisphaerales bacterium]|nr:ABC transporter permease [Sedimentisphaerales bacterium]